MVKTYIDNYIKKHGIEKTLEILKRREIKINARKKYKAILRKDNG